MGDGQTDMYVVQREMDRQDRTPQYKTHLSTDAETGGVEHGGRYTTYGVGKHCQWEGRLERPVSPEQPTSAT